MTKKIYRYMNWPEIEGIIYSDTDQPGELLGPHAAGSQTLVQAFLPGADEAAVITDMLKAEYPMELADEAGYFAALLPFKKVKEYRLRVKYTRQEEDQSGNEGQTQAGDESQPKDAGRSKAGGRSKAAGQSHEITTEIHDPYAFPAEECAYIDQPEEAPKKGAVSAKGNDGHSADALSDPAQMQSFHAGTQYCAWKYMGAHRAVCRGVTGILFRVWAPEAQRVSVVGEWNCYDGRVHQMNRSTVTDVFELFIPDLKEGIGYQYEIRKRNGDIVLKSDPYASYLYDGDEHYLLARVERQTYSWSSADLKRSHTGRAAEPMHICEISLMTLLGDETEKEMQSKALEAKAKELADAGYTHVEIQDTMLRNTDNHSVHETIGFYAVNGLLGDSDRLRLVTDRLHAQGLSVILEWAPGCFSKAGELLSEYDGTCLYEHLDPRQGFHNAYQVKLFQYRRPEVASFLLSSLNYLIEEFHADGIRVCDTSFMLYLDYGKNIGEWIPNLYGGNENTDAIEFLKRAVSMVKQRHPDVLMITDEASGWQNLTKPLSEDGFGFDYKWNYGLVNDLLRYLTIPYYERKRFHHELTLSYLYMYKERFINALSEDYILKSDCGLACMKTDQADLKAATARLIPAYLILHPGAKFDSEAYKPQELKKYISSLNRFYLANPALYKADEDEVGFEWINSISANESVLLFLRRSDMQTLLIGINFSDQTWMSRKAGVPYDGKYKEIFNTDSVEFGGGGVVNPRTLKAKKDECDTREYSIRINLAPMSASVLQYIPYTEDEIRQMQDKELERQRKKEEEQRKKERLKKKKEKIRASLKEELARKIAQAEAEIASGSEYRSGGRKS